MSIIEGPVTPGIDTLSGPDKYLVQGRTIITMSGVRKLAQMGYMTAIDMDEAADAYDKRAEILSQREYENPKLKEMLIDACRRQAEWLRAEAMTLRAKMEEAKRPNGKDG